MEQCLLCVLGGKCTREEADEFGKMWLEEGNKLYMGHPDTSQYNWCQRINLCPLCGNVLTKFEEETK